MKGKDAFDLMRQTSDFLKLPNVEIAFVKDLPVGFGDFGFYGNYLDVRIGVSEFDQFPDVEFSDAEVTSGVVSLFHEICGHGIQVTREFDKDTPLSQVLALSHYACEGSAYYYGVDDSGYPHNRYFKHPHEIAAQYAGIYMADKFLSDMYGKERADRMVCNYVNDRISKESEFVFRKKYDSVSDILSDFDKTFQSSAKKHREYVFEKDKGSDLVQYAKEKNDIRFLTRMQSCSDGIHQDWIMASAHLALNDTDFSVRSKPVFRKINMDPAYAVGRFGKAVKPPPKPKDLSLDKQIRAELDRILEKDSESDDYEFT